MHLWRSPIWTATGGSKRIYTGISPINIDLGVNLHDLGLENGSLYSMYKGLCCFRRLLRVPWTARRSNQSILKEINPEYSLEEWMMLKLFRAHFSLMEVSPRNLLDPSSVRVVPCSWGGAKGPRSWGSSAAPQTQEDSDLNLSLRQTGCPWSPL